MKKNPSTFNQSGFTLIELMVVIVIVGVMASLILLNIDGVDQRKAMQARELLILDLKRINREANDQARIYALDVQSATDVAPFRYGLVEYQSISPDSNRLASNTQQSNVFQQNKWKELKNFQLRSLPNHVSFAVESQTKSYQNANNDDLIGTNAPKIIWFGNGEVKPVSIQMYYDQNPVGALINIDYLGKVDDEI